MYAFAAANRQRQWYIGARHTKMREIQLPEKVSYIIRMLARHGYDAYAVGGCIRDSLLGREPDDWDITTQAKPEQIKAIFHRTVDTGIQHGTVTVLVDGEGFEVTTYRIDGEYEDHRHPKEVAFTDNLVEDLRRRDFTINAMAYNEQAGLVDAFDGQKDLECGQIRCVGVAKERFEEDALRVLRGIRFAAQLGFFIEEGTKQAMMQLAPNLSAISAERIQVELVKLLLSPHPDMLRLAYELGITKVFLPEFDRMMQVEQHNPHHCYTVGEHTLCALQLIGADKTLRLAVLLHDIGKPDTESVDEDGISHFYGHAKRSEELTHSILRRLKFDNDTLSRVRRLVRWHDYRFILEKAAIRRAVHKIGEDLFEELLLVMEADVRAQSSYMQAEKLKELEMLRAMYWDIKRQEDCLNLKQLAVTGKDLIALGVPQGKEIGCLLEALLGLVLEHPDWNIRELLLEKVSSGFVEGQGVKIAIEQNDKIEK